MKLPRPFGVLDLVYVYFISFFFHYFANVGVQPVDRATGYKFINSSPHYHPCDPSGAAGEPPLHCACWMSHETMNKSDSPITSSILRGFSRAPSLHLLPRLYKLKSASVANVKRPTGCAVTLLMKWKPAIGFNCNDIISLFFNPAFCTVCTWLSRKIALVIFQKGVFPFSPLIISTLCQDVPHWKENV